MNLLEKLKATLKNSITVPGGKASVFFKTGEGQYGHGDQFIGVSVPDMRKIAQGFEDLTFEDLQILVQSPINEERFMALIILVSQYNKGSDEKKEEVYQFYLRNLKYVNNWNLVDASAHLIIGSHLFDYERDLLLDLAKSNVLWERRIAIVSTWYFIRKNDLNWTFKIALILLKDPHDLIHKAVGWMLREAGKRDTAELVKFLDHNAQLMPRTMLRYAIEKFSPEERQKYLTKKSLK